MHEYLPNRLEKLKLLRQHISSIEQLGFMNVTIVGQEIILHFVPQVAEGYRQLLSQYWSEKCQCYRFYEFNLHLKEIKLAEKLQQWQYRTKHDTDWKNCSDEEYEHIQHLARFEFRQINL